MVSQKTLREYEFETIEDYFYYIETSLIVGQRQQAKELIKELSKAQKKQALNWFESSYALYDTNESKEAASLVIDYI